MRGSLEQVAETRVWAMQGRAEASFAARLEAAELPKLDALETAGGQLIKRSTTRSVYRLELGGRCVYLKHHRVRDWLERLKYVLRPSRAAAEWQAARALRAAGLQVAPPLLYADRRENGLLQEAVYVCEEVAGAPSLNALLADLPAGSPGRQSLLAEIARLVRQTHDARLLHRDLHGDNLLRAGAGLVLIDLHRVRLGWPVSQRQRAANLAQLLAPLPLAADERRDLLAAYLGDGTLDLDALAADVEVRIEQRRERRYRSRTRRCVVPSTGFRPDRLEGVRVFRRSEFQLDQVQSALERHRALSAQDADVLKWDDRTRVSVVEIGSDTRICVKEFRPRPGLRRLWDRVTTSPARRAWVGAQALSVRGIRTPRALAAVDGQAGFFLSEFIEDARTLHEFVADHRDPAPGEATSSWRAFIRELASFVRTLHQHRLRHRDLSAKNILVGPNDDLYLVDVGDVRQEAPSPDFTVRNLGQLAQLYIPPSLRDRLRFFWHYSRGSPELHTRAVLVRIDAIAHARQENWLAHGAEAWLAERRRLGKPV